MVLPGSRTGGLDRLRFITAGSVDDGKSTLIGRLLHDAHAVPQDQLAALQRSAWRNGAAEIDLSLLTDGLTAERQQGITIDVAYRYISTGRRKFIIADTPGHEQYVRNMVTGASTADAAVILVDIANGITLQTRRHFYLSRLMCIPHVIVAINKMDLVGYSHHPFDAMVREIDALAASLGAPPPALVPLSAKLGDNVVRPSTKMPWYERPTLLELLENLPAPLGFDTAPFRFPVQMVQRVSSSAGRPTRRYLGRIESGVVARGDHVVVLPADIASTISSITTFDGDLDLAAAPLSIGIELEDAVDVSRGEIIVHAAARPRVAREVDVLLCWLADDPFDAKAQLIFRLGTTNISARLAGLMRRLDVNTLKWEQDPAGLSRNDIAGVRLVTQSPIAFDSYQDCRATGAGILIDPLTNATVAAVTIQNPTALLPAT